MTTARRNFRRAVIVCVGMISMHRAGRAAAGVILLLLALSPSQSHPQSSVSDGRALFDQRQFAAARAKFEAAARANDRDPWAHYWWGRALFSEDKPGAAAERLERAIALDAQQAEFHLWAGHSYGVDAQRANVLRQPMLARRVKAAYERAVALDPSLVDARMGLLQFYLQAPGFMGGSPAKAREQAQALLGINPVQGRIAFATIASRDKDWAGVERELVALVREQPDSGRGAAALANFYADRNQPDDAFRAYDQWLARHPQDALGLYGVGRTAAVTGQQLDRGVQALTQVLALPDDARERGGVSKATVLWRLGMIHEKAGRKPDARTAYAEALRLAPDLRGAREGLKRVS